ncbi:putative leucine-rich repeat protein [Diplonema papillatum]|nr:putative leucine-rich repeat protein [Diplonema papillatum]
MADPTGADVLGQSVPGGTPGYESMAAGGRLEDAGGSVGVSGGDPNDQPKKKTKDMQQVGLSVYIRKKIKQEDKEGGSKTKTFWILEGKTYEDREYVWEERRAREGHIQYRNAATGKSTRVLPDVGATQSALGPGAGGIAQITPKRLKQDPRPGWVQEQKSAIQAFIKKKLARAVREGALTPDAQKVLVKNVTDAYMSQNDPFEGDAVPDAVDPVLTTEAAEALDAWLKEKGEATEQLKSAIDYTDLAFVDKPLPDEEAVLPDKPDREPQAPVSPYLPRATFLRDAFYYMRVDYENPRRSALEEELEAKLFFNPSMGQVKVLGAIQGWVCHPADPKQNQESIIAVVRDWVGAYCIAYVQPPTPLAPDYTITGIHPVNEHVEVGKLLGKQAGSDILRGIVIIDDQRHVLGVRSNEDHRYLDLCLKLAMCSMFGQGQDDDRINRMRAHAVEFAWGHLTPVPAESALSKLSLLMSGTEEELAAGGDVARQTDSLVHDIRLFMLGTENRDLVLQKWVAGVQRNKNVSAEQILRQLRVIEEAIRYPAPTNDPFTPEAVLAQLSQLQLELSRIETQMESIPWNLHPSRLIALWKGMVEAMRGFESREVIPDVPHEKCCDAAPHSEAAAIQRRHLEERRANYAQDQLPSGVYLSCLVYCGDQILSDGHSNLPCELVKEVLSDSISKSFTRESEDFKWIARIGVDVEWAEIIQTYSQVFDNSGTARFRAAFLEAAKRLQAQMGREDLGIVFDTLVRQDEVQCIHVVTILRVAQKSDIPLHTPVHVGWGWRPAADIEYNTYLKSFEIEASARVAFFPSGYNNCKRWVHAAMQFRESLDQQLLPGVYLAYFGALPSSSGFKVMVSETHRYMVPLAKVQDAFPTLEEWRWVQCLIEKKRRVGSFEWTTIGEGVTPDMTRPVDLPTFRHRFLRAILELQETIGREVAHIYDRELIPFNESGTVKIIAVGERLLDQPPPHRPPPGTTPVCFKDWELTEALYFQMSWPTIWRNFLEATTAADAGQLRVCQPFAADEMLRLDQQGALAYSLEVQSMLLPLRWLWTLWCWATSGYQTIVQECEGKVDKTVVRGIEESVETAVANHASQQDINYLTMKSIATEVSRDPGWDAVYVKLREIMRTMKNGYSHRVQQVPPKGDPTPYERTWDELYPDEGSDDDVDRPPTIYQMECTLEELIERDGTDSGGGPSTYFAMQNIVLDVVELALIESVDAAIIRVSGQAVNDMVTLLEWTDALVNDAVVLAMKENAVQATMNENKLFKGVWHDIFNDDARDNEPDQDYLADMSDDEWGDDHEEPMYHQGTPTMISSPEAGVRVCMAKAMNSVHVCEELLKVISSAQEVAELTDCITGYDTAVAKQVEIIKSCIVPAGGGGPAARHPDASMQPPAAPHSAARRPSLSAAAATPEHGLTRIEGAVRDDGNPAGYSFAGADAATPLPQPSPGPRPHPTPRAFTSVSRSEFADAGPHDLVMVSSDYREFPTNYADLSRCAALQNAKGKIRFPAVSAALLSIVAEFLTMNDGQVPTFLQSLEGRLQAADIPPADMFGLAIQLKSPLLLSALSGLVYGRTAGPNAAQHAFTQDTAGQLWNAIEGTMLAFSIRDWIHWESHGGPAVAAALDVCWWGRTLHEAAPGDAVSPFADHLGAWRQVYAESRVRAFLTRGLSTLPSEEISLWNSAFGALVEYISLKDSPVSDPEVEVLTMCCPHLKSVDLSLTDVTDTAVEYLVGRCHSLADINVDGTRISPVAKARVLAFAGRNAVQAHP